MAGRDQIEFIVEQQKREIEERKQEIKDQQRMERI